MEGRHEAGQPACANQRARIDWDQVDWAGIERHVERAQQRIFRDARKGNYRKVNQQQKLLVKSLPARLRAAKLVTEVNAGRLTPGIDGRLFLTGKEKARLAEEMRFRNYTPDPVKVTWIPKADGSQRKLGIPTLRDRAMQALVLLAMDPEWEAKFEPHSFGFRPGRSAIDAVRHIANTLMHQKGRRPHAGWVFDADIAKCFDNIDHEALLAKVGPSPFRAVIKAWLKAGAVSRVGFEKTRKGTPQGGVISPLLANIALDGLERQFGIFTRTGNYKKPSCRGGLNKDVALFRYADDFIALAPSKENIDEYVAPKVKTFLATVGLDLSAAKTRVVNISEGFEFLGFTFQRYYRKDGSIKQFTYFPSRKRIDRFLAKLKEYVHYNWSRDVKKLIEGINRRVIGFCNYFRWSNARKAFSYLSHRLWEILWRWAHRRHPKRNSKWIKTHYWKVTETRKWAFMYQGAELVNPPALAVKDWWKRPKVRIMWSPYDTGEESGSET